MSEAQVKEIISRIMSDERFRSRMHLTDKIYEDEPILRTGRQMASYLPEQYREMRAISRWQPGNGVGAGRWLTEAELFYRQGMFMADFEDDCPYHRALNIPYATYNSLSDRQLRGYFTWRASVRRGDTPENCTTFAFMYLYELLCGIGVNDPMDGFHKIQAFWHTWQNIDHELDRYIRIWLQDYVVYHDLDPRLLQAEKTVIFDQALIDLGKTTEAARVAARSELNPSARGRANAAALPLPPREDIETALYRSVTALSTYDSEASTFGTAHHTDLRHVCCAVYVRMTEYYEAHRKCGLIESFFGTEAKVPYTMFASAVFFDPVQHPDTEYHLNEIHTYSCRNGFWECIRVHGSRQRSPKLGDIMRLCEQRLHLALDASQQPESDDAPKYLVRIVDREIAEWLAWKESHRPRRIDIDLASLGHIRAAAAETREALLIDEERTGVAPTEPAVVKSASVDAVTAEEPMSKSVAADGVTTEEPMDKSVADERPRTGQAAVTCPTDEPVAAASLKTGSTIAKPSTTVQGEATSSREDDRTRKAYLRALLEHDTAAAQAAVKASGQSEDMLADVINEALFDLVGDTVIEFGATGPQIIEEYTEDVRGYLGHE